MRVSIYKKNKLKKYKKTEKLIKKIYKKMKNLLKKYIKK
jgi:hypothetical protein